MSLLVCSLSLAAPVFFLSGCGGAGPGAETTQKPDPFTTPEPDPRMTQQDRVQRLLQMAAEEAGDRFGCAISLGFKNADFEAAAASGHVATSSNVKVKASDKFLFGSCTKMVTGASILKLVSEGKLGLDDSIQEHVDPYLSKLSTENGAPDIARLADVFDAERLKKLTIRRVLHMSTGMTDFNTAHAKHDPLRDMIIEKPDEAKTPLQMLDLKWVRNSWKMCRRNNDPDADCYRYSNTNFMLLGLVLASKTGAETWSDLDQSQFLPESCQDGSIAFGIKDPPSSATPVHGYDRTSHMDKKDESKNDFHDVAGEFNGMAALNVMASPLGFARFAWELFGPNHTVIPQKYADMMHKGDAHASYGLGAQLNRGDSGQTGAYGEYWGHSGTRYGYQSFVQYFPKLQMTLAGASNIETDRHPQTDVAFCYAYNYIAAELTGFKDMSCKFEKECKCTRLPADSADAAVTV